LLAFSTLLATCRIWRMVLPLAAAIALLSTLGVGDKAPPLKVGAIVKGKAVNLGKGVHVVEFWATWCGPCLKSIPHLSELAQKYKGKVDFTGVSVWETGADQLGRVRKFVTGMGAKMDYNVAFDGPAKAMDLGLMKAANQDSIPNAFLIKDGTILWIGHPMDGLEETIDRLLAGRFDLATAKAEAKRKVTEDAARDRREAAEAAALAAARAALARKDYQAGLRELDKIDASADKALAHYVLMTRFYTFARMGDPRLREAAKSVVAENGEDAEVLLTVVARDLIDPESKFPVVAYAAALTLAEGAVAISPKRPNVLDCYAAVLAKTGKAKEAADAEAKAVEYAKADPKFAPERLKVLLERLNALKSLRLSGAPGDHQL